MDDPIQPRPVVAQDIHGNTVPLAEAMASFRDHDQPPADHGWVTTELVRYPPGPWKRLLARIQAWHRARTVRYDANHHRPTSPRSNA